MGPNDVWTAVNHVSNCSKLQTDLWGLEKVNFGFDILSSFGAEDLRISTLFIHNIIDEVNVVHDSGIGPCNARSVVN